MENNLRRKALQVVKNYQIRLPAGSNGTHAVQAVNTRSVDGCQTQSTHRLHAQFYRHLYAVTDSALAADIGKMLIIGAEGQTAYINTFFNNAAQNCRQITRSTALTHQHCQTVAQLFLRLVPADAFMVGIDTAGNIGSQLLATHAGCVAVDYTAQTLEQVQFFLYLGGIINNSRHIHHLAHSEYTGLIYKLNHIARIHHAAAVLEACGRHAARQVHIIIQRHLSAGLQHIANACRTRYVGNFVRVGNQCGYAPTQLLGTVMLRHGHRAFYMTMCINQTGGNICSLQVDDFFCLIIAADTGNHALGNSNISFVNCFGQHVNNPAVLQKNISRAVTECDRSYTVHHIYYLNPFTRKYISG